MKVALVHDWLTGMGGAERVLEDLCGIFPEAPVYTSVCDKDRLSDTLRKKDIRTSFIQKLPFAKQRYRDYLPLMPFAFESFDLKGYDLVISSSHACAKGVMTGPNTCHICYCYTPMRYAWDMYHEYLRFEKVRGLKRLLAPLAMLYLRTWDRISSKRADHFIAISDFVAGRIKKYYGRESTVIYPPIDASKFKPAAGTGGYYLAVSRLVPQKRTDIVIEAFNKLGYPLKVIGTGRDMADLKAIAGPSVEMLGFVSDPELAEYLSGCKALVFASHEDFGIVPLEAQASGRPAIVYGKGGAGETIIPGKTGIIFEEQTPGSIIDAVKKFEKMSFDSAAIRKHAEDYDKEIFKRKIIEFVEEKMGCR
ncbi:MAG: glycosyltransferase [Candidatus Saganbacteria bacterium]|nr:glycosyltransferase [Candidatus Saganbacteria bacterium]